MSKYPELIKTKIYSKHLGNKLLIFGSCIEQEYPEVLEKLSKDYIPLSVCLEESHMNTVIGKMLSIVNVNDLEEVMMLSQDGSPHCIGLHFVLETIKKMAKSNNFKTRYCVLEHGKLIEVSPEDVKIARHLSKVKELKK